VKRSETHHRSTQVNAGRRSMQINADWWVSLRFTHPTGLQDYRITGLQDYEKKRKEREKERERE